MGKLILSPKKTRTTVQIIKTHTKGKLDLISLLFKTKHFNQILMVDISLIAEQVIWLELNTIRVVSFR